MLWTESKRATMIRSTPSNNEQISQPIITMGDSPPASPRSVKSMRTDTAIIAKTETSKTNQSINKKSEERTSTVHS